MPIVTALERRWQALDQSKQAFRTRSYVDSPHESRHSLLGERPETCKHLSWQETGARVGKFKKE